jgi:pimeloyl-ACP methyl ester carboxylesterase
VDTGHPVTGRPRWRPAGLKPAAAGLALLALGLLTGCSGSSGGATPQAVAPGLTGLHRCPDQPGFSCGTLTVPLDPAGKVPGHLKLAVAVSDVSSAPRGDLVFLSGGPGQPGVPFVARVSQRLGHALDGYRMVAIDQRGTGAGALSCPALQQQMGSSDLAPPTAAAVQSCAARVGPDRRFYATTDTVADLEALRVALRAPKLSLDGVSYGTYVAERYALAHPSRAGKLVLDSVVPSWNVDPFQLATMRRSATVLRAVCAASHCGFDPARDLATVVRRYHDGPKLLDMLVSLSVGAPSYPGVLTALETAASGQPTALTHLMSEVHAADGATAPELSQGLHASSLCADLHMPWGGPDTPLAVRQARLDKAVARLTPAQTWPFDSATAAGNGFIRTCRWWPPVQATAPAAPQRLPAVPVLLLAGSNDLSTPLPEVLAEKAQAPRGQLVMFRGDGHSVQTRANGNAAAPVVRRFLAGG